MPKVLVLVPVPLDEEGVANRQAQRNAVALGPDIEFDYRPLRAGSDWGDSHHDYLLGDLGIYEAGMTAQEEGYDAVCIDTMTDSGMNALRSVLDIPVIGPGRTSYLMALMLGNRFSVLTQWDGWIPFYKKELQEYGLADKCASVRSINVLPDLRNLLGGKEEVVFPKLVAAGLQCVEDGAEVICLGSTTMHQSHDHLRKELPVPVINPGPLTYKMAELVIGLGLSHSRAAYPSPRSPKPEMMRVMLDAAAGVSDHG
jgi:Asp/Glu/hydantoin racemase